MSWQSVAIETPRCQWISGKGAVSGDQPIGHQGFDQAVLTGQQPVRLGVAEGHAQGGGAGQVLGIKAQAAAVAPPTFRRMQFREQLRPAPASPAQPAGSLGPG